MSGSNEARCLGVNRVGKQETSESDKDRQCSSHPRKCPLAHSRPLDPLSQQRNGGVVQKRGRAFITGFDKYPKKFFLKPQPKHGWVQTNEPAIQSAGHHALSGRILRCCLASRTTPSSLAISVARSPRPKRDSR